MNAGHPAAAETPQTPHPRRPGIGRGPAPIVPTPPFPELRRLLAEDQAATGPLVLDEQAFAFFRVLRKHRLDEWLDARMNSLKKAVGRSRSISTIALLVGISLSGRHAEPPTIERVADLLYHQLRPPARRLLGIEPPVPCRDARWASLTDGQKAKRQRDAEAKNVERSLKRVLAAIDPSIHPKNMVTKPALRGSRWRPRQHVDGEWRATWTELLSLSRPLTKQEQAELQLALDWFAARLLRIVWEEIPASSRRYWQGDKDVDATLVAVYSREQIKSSVYVPADPDAAMWGREGSHSEADQSSGTKKSEYVYGYDLHLLVACDRTPGDRQYVPAVPLALSLSRPGFAASAAARKMLAATEALGYTAGFLSGDGVYTTTVEGDFRQMVRDSGHQFIGRVVNERKGHWASLNGMHVVDESLYCPMLPERLVDLSERLDKCVPADEPALHRLGAERARYAVRVKQTVERGGCERWQCPAAGNNPTAACWMKEAARAAKEGQKPPTPEQVTKKANELGKPLILPPEEVRARPRPSVCDAESVVTDPDDTVLFRQALQPGTEEHTIVLRRLRNSQEGMHGVTKNDAGAAIGAKGRRRVLGIAAQQLIVAFQVFGAALANVHRFLRDAIPDEHGDLYVVRRTRPERPHPLKTGNPQLKPGAPPGGNAA